MRKVPQPGQFPLVLVGPEEQLHRALGRGALAGLKSFVFVWNRLLAT
ncbi:hypothetical protein [Streptomyces sp. CBMA152]|nr:hypothetical protein [Streptomyces sp. CBMA152]